MKHYNFVAVGAGPSNISLAAQASEIGMSSKDDFLILEKKTEVSWHPGMLLPGSRLDTHFAKDLVTMVNPKSEFTFLNFLAKNNRLEDFLNCGTPHPFRAEFDEYLRWAYQLLKKNIKTGFNVQRIEQRKDRMFDIIGLEASGLQRKYVAENVVCGMGGGPKMLCGLTGHESRVIHTSDFLHKISAIEFTPDTKVLIVGAGQSAGEIIQYMLNNTSCQLQVSISDFALSAKEGTAFINESYNGDFVNRFYDMSAEMKEWFTEKRKNMNCGVIDEKLISTLYNDNYYSKYYKNRKIDFLSFSRVENISVLDSHVLVCLHDSESGENIDSEYDYIILATGYDSNLDPSVLNGILGGDEIIVNRNFSIAHKALSNRNSVYLNGDVSASHGPAEDVLSVIAHRARDILNSIEAGVVGADLPKAKSQDSGSIEALVPIA